MNVCPYRLKRSRPWWVWSLTLQRKRFCTRTSWKLTVRRRKQRQHDTRTCSSRSEVSINYAGGCGGVRNTHVRYLSWLASRANLHVLPLWLFTSHFLHLFVLFVFFYFCWSLFIFFLPFFTFPLYLFVTSQMRRQDDLITNSSLFGRGSRRNSCYF